MGEHIGMLLENLRLETKENTVKLIADVHSSFFGEKTIWAEINKKYAHALTVENYNAFLVGLLYPAMCIGEDIHIQGAVSAKLLYNIQHYLIPFIQTYTPTCKAINVTTDKTIANLPGKEHHVGTGYSAGVDSLCTIYDHLEKENNPAYKLDTLLFLNTGSHGEFSKSTTEPKFRARFEYLQKTAPLPLIALNTNIHQFHEIFPNSHQKTVTFTNAAGVLVLEKYFSKYYIASAENYAEMIEFGKHCIDFDPAPFEPITLPLLSTETLEFIADGQQYTRSQKTIRISNYLLAQKALNVCVNGCEQTAKNCSHCSKCLRTLMTLDSLNKLDEFSTVFDISIYRKHIFQYKCQQRLLYYTNPFAKDNVDLARKNQKYIPSLLVANIIYTPKTIKGIVRKLRNKLLKRK